ncbi:hypothetical protein V8E55_010651 [Tylopilus felleus]
MAHLCKLYGLHTHFNRVQLPPAYIVQEKAGRKKGRKQAPETHQHAPSKERIIDRNVVAAGGIHWQDLKFLSVGSDNVIEVGFVIMVYLGFERHAQPCRTVTHGANINPKLEYLVDICIVLLVRDSGLMHQILQTVLDFAQKQIETRDLERGRQQSDVGFGARVTQQMWKGFTNQEADESSEEEDEEEEEEKEEEDEKVNEGANETEMPFSQASLWDYAEKLKDSDAVAAFSKVSTNWCAKALGAWGVRKGSNNPASPGPVAPTQLTPSPSAVSEITSRQSGWPGLSDRDVQGQQQGSLPGMQCESEHANLDPPPPAFFHSPRESFLPQPRRHWKHATAPPSLHVEPRLIQDSDTESNALSSFIHQAGTSLASLATSQLSHLTPKSMPRLLMLSSHDFTTNKSSQSHPSRRHVRKAKRICLVHVVHLAFRIHAQAHAQITSRRVALNRKSISLMVLASRLLNLPWNTPSPSMGGVVLGIHCQMGASSEHGWWHFDGEECFDSPTMFMSPPISHTTLMTPISGPGVVRIVNGRSAGGEHVAMSSISTLSEASEMPPIPGTPDRETQLSSGSGDSELSLEWTSLGKAAAAKLRSKRYVSRSGNLHPEGDLATTPKVENYSRAIAEEGVEEGVGAVVLRPTIVRKSSKEAQLRKISSTG